MSTRESRVSCAWLYFPSGNRLVVMSNIGKVQSGNGSVDSFTATTTVMDSSASVQSFLIPDSLTVAYEPFSRLRQNIGRDARIRRSVCNMIQRSQSDTTVKLSAQKPRLEIPKCLRVIGKPPKRCVPPANLLRPPRGSLVCPMKDLSRELLAIRKLPRSERLSAGARFIRTLDTSCPSHNDIAQSIYLICTL